MAAALFSSTTLPKIARRWKRARESGISTSNSGSTARTAAFHWLAGKGQVMMSEACSCAARSMISASASSSRRGCSSVNETLEARVAELREEARTLEVLNRTGIAVGAEHDLERLVQIVTDAGVELSGAEFGAFFYNVIRRGRRSLHALHPVRRAARGLRQIPDAAQHRNLRTDVPRRRGRSLARHPGRSALRQKRALSRDAAGHCPCAAIWRCR